MVDFNKLLAQKKSVEPPATRDLWLGTIQMARVSRATRRRQDNPWVLEDVISGTWYVDTTIKGRHPLFAPGWDIVLDHKSGQISDEQYVAIYRERMQASYKANKADWLQLLRAAYAGEHTLILICFCRNGNFCHRYQLKDMLLKVCAKQAIPVHDCGEWSV